MMIENTRATSSTPMRFINKYNDISYLTKFPFFTNLAKELFFVMKSDDGSDGFKQVKNDFAFPGSAIVRINGKS
jgi:hypothetical protein